MSEFATFLPQELAEIGLVAFSDPAFAERLIDALRRLPDQLAVGSGPSSLAPGAQQTLYATLAR